MEIDKNNMDEFFKNRLNNFDDSDGDWDLPSERAWENAKGNFPKHPKKRTFNRSNLALIFLGLTLGGAIGVILFQQKNIAELKSKFAIAEAEITSRKNAFSDIEKELSELKTEYSEINSELIFQNKKSAEQIAFFQKRAKKDAILLAENASQINQQLVEIEKLNTENNRFRKQITTFKIAEEKQLNAAKNDALLSQRAIKSLPKIATLSTSLLKDKPIVFTNTLMLKAKKNPKKRNWKKNEIGFYLTNAQYQIPLSYNFFDLNPIAVNNAIQTLNTYGFGLNFGRGLKKNLFFKTGIQIGAGAIHRDLFSALPYNKSGEFTNLNGDLSNDWLFETNSPLGAVENRLIFNVPRGADIPDGDLIALNLQNIQELVFLKMPIGLDYYIGQKRWKSWSQAGLSMNATFLGDYLASGTLNHGNENIPVEKFDIIDKQEIGSTFINAYFGIGVDYKLGSRVHFRGGYSKEFNLVTTAKLLPANSPNFDTDGLEFGLHFRF